MTTKDKEKVKYRNRVIVKEGNRIIIIKGGNPIKRKFTSLTEATDFIDERVR